MLTADLDNETILVKDQRQNTVEELRTEFDRLRASDDEFARDYRRGEFIDWLNLVTTGGAPITQIDNALEVYGYKDKAGREKIASDIVHTHGKVTGVIEGRGHVDVLYQPNGTKYTWKIPTTIIKPLNP